MSWNDWKPTKGVFESDKDLKIRTNEWENRETNRSRWFSPETGGSGSRTTSSSSSTSSSDDAAGGLVAVGGVIIIIGAIIALIYLIVLAIVYGILGIIYLILTFWLQIILWSIAIAGLFYALGKWYIPYLAKANNYLRITEEFFSGWGSLAIYDIIADSKTATSIKLAEKLGISEQATRFVQYIKRIPSYILYGTLFLIDYVLSIITRAILFMLTWAIPISIFIGTCMLIYQHTPWNWYDPDGFMPWTKTVFHWLKETANSTGELIRDIFKWIGDKCEWIENKCKSIDQWVKHLFD